MNAEEILSLAENFLTEKKIDFVKPGEIDRESDSRFEVVFLIPKALDPDCVIDPPDVRVIVDVDKLTVELVPQM